MNKYYLMNKILEEQGVMERAEADEIGFAEAEGDRFLDEGLEAVDSMWDGMEVKV